MKRRLVAVLLFISCFTVVLAMVAGTGQLHEDGDVLHRQKRAKKPKPPAHKPTCPKGTWADLKYNEEEATGFQVNCSVCPPDSYTATTGLHMSCLSCNTSKVPSGSLPGTTTALYRQTCYKKCVPGKRWTGKMPSKPLGKASCPPCAPGYYHDEYNFDTRCKPCPVFFTSKKGAKKCSILSCPRGFQPSADHTTCLHCPSGYFKPKEGNAMCTKCPEDDKNWNWTHTVGANTSKGECFTTESKKVRATPCFSYLAAALAQAGPFIYADTTGKVMRTLEDALIDSGVDLTEVKRQAYICSELEVKVGKEMKVALPTLRFNATHVIHFPSKFYKPTTTSTTSSTTTTTFTTTTTPASTPSSTTSSTSTTTMTTPTTTYEEGDNEENEQDEQGATTNANPSGQGATTSA